MKDTTYQTTKLLTLIIILSFFILFQKILFAGPPFFTDDPVPVEYKHTEIYVASTYIRDKGGASGSLPMLDMNYGILPDLHAHVTTPFNFNHSKAKTDINEDGEEETVPARTDFGYGDTELGFKYRLIRESRLIPHIAIYPAVELPTGNSKRGLGNGKAQLFLPVWLQKSWGAWTSYGGAGYWFNPGEGNKNWTYLGWVVQRDISKQLNLGGEMTYRTPDKKGERSGLGLNFGGQINITQNHHLLASAGTDVYGPRHFTLYIAYQLTF